MGGLMGGVTGGLMGGMTGGMKIEESLYLKGSAPSDGRDGELFAYSQQKSGNVTFKIFPYWELSVPLLGTDSE